MNYTALLLASLALCAIPSWASAQEGRRGFSGDLFDGDYTLSEEIAKLCISDSDSSTCRTLVGANTYGQASACSNEDLWRTATRYVRRNFDNVNFRRVTDEFSGDPNIMGLGGLRSLFNRDQDGSMFVALVECRMEDEPTGIYALIVDLEDSQARKRKREFVPEGIIKVALQQASAPRLEAVPTETSTMVKPTVEAKPAEPVTEATAEATPRAANNDVPATASGPQQSLRGQLLNRLDELSKDDIKAMVKSLSEKDIVILNEIFAQP